MIYDHRISSSPFRLAPGYDAAALRKLVAEISDDYEIKVIEDQPGVFELQFEGQIGNSFGLRIEHLANRLGPLLASAITIREEVATDDCDAVYFAGPTPEAVRAQRQAEAIHEARQALTAAAFPKLDVDLMLGSLVGQRDLRAKEAQAFSQKYQVPVEVVTQICEELGFHQQLLSDRAAEKILEVVRQRSAGRTPDHCPPRERQTSAG